jgi:hypothetical protein
MIERYPPLDMIERRERADMTDRTLPNDDSEKALAADATDPMEANDPIEPIDSTLPTEPIERIELRLPIERIDPSDLHDHFEGAGAAPPFERSAVTTAPRRVVCRRRPRPSIGGEASEPGCLIGCRPLTDLRSVMPQSPFCDAHRAGAGRSQKVGRSGLGTQAGTISTLSKRRHPMRARVARSVISEMTRCGGTDAATMHVTVPTDGAAASSTTGDAAPTHRPARGPSGAPPAGGTVVGGRRRP